MLKNYFYNVENIYGDSFCIMCQSSVFSKHVFAISYKLIAVGVIGKEKEKPLFTNYYSFAYPLCSKACVIAFCLKENIIAEERLINPIIQHQNI